MTVLASASELEDAARYVVGLAQKLEQVDEDLEQRAQHLAWRGSAADRFGGQVTSAHQMLRGQAEQLLRAGHLLSLAADKVQAERAALTRDENLVETILRGEQDPAGFLRSAGWTERSLPPAGDTAWRLLAKKAVAAAERNGPPNRAPSGGAAL